MNGLTDYFERVTVISLVTRTDRRQRLLAHLEDLGLAGGVEWIDAVPGTARPAPPGWSAGPGAWGCLQSHLTALHRAESDRLESLLIIEDDVVFSSHTTDCLPHLIKALPDDWGQFYLGGQHMTPPKRTENALIRRGTNINRTHAYAYRVSTVPQVIGHLTRWEDYVMPPGRAGWHMDHQLGYAHENELWPCYASSWWLAGQEADVSDICSQSLRRRWWHPEDYAFFLPYVYLNRGLRKDDEVRFLTGPEDEYFRRALTADAPLLCWLHSHAQRALDHGCLPAWHSPQLDPARVAELWPAGLRDERAPGICDYPFNGLFNHSITTLLPQVS